MKNESAEMQVAISIKDLEMVTQLIAALSEHAKDLPEPVAAALMRVMNDSDGDSEETVARDVGK